MSRIKMDNNARKWVEHEIEILKQTNCEMRQQIDQEIHRNELHIMALEQLLRDDKEEEE